MLDVVGEVLCEEFQFELGKGRVVLLDSMQC